MPEEIQPQPSQSKSSRTFEEWKLALIKIIAAKHDIPIELARADNERIKPYYDRALMPSVCYNELFNK